MIIVSSIYFLGGYHDIILHTSESNLDREVFIKIEVQKVRLLYNINYEGHRDLATFFCFSSSESLLDRHLLE